MTAFNEQVLKDPATKEDLMKEILKETGKEILIKLKDNKAKKSEGTEKSELSKLDIDVNIIE